MKFKLAALVAGALLATGANAQIEVGYDLGSTCFNFRDGTTQNRTNNNLKIGFQDERNGLGAEAIYAYTNKSQFGSGITRFDQSAYGAKLLAKTEVPIAMRVSGVLKGGMGYQRNQINYKVTNNTVKNQEYFPTMAFGINFKASEQLKVGVNMNHDRRAHFKLKENTYLTAGFSYSFDASKLA